MCKIMKLSIGDLIIGEAGTGRDIFISLKDTDFDFDYYRFYDTGECRYFTTEENVTGLIDDIEENLCALAPEDKEKLLDVFDETFSSISSDWRIKMKTDRINIRVSPEIKGEIEKAADQMGLSVSAYLIMLHKMQKNGVQLHGAVMNEPSQQNL